MADEDGATGDMPTMTDLSNQNAPQARPARTNNESATTSSFSRVPSKSPPPNTAPVPESATKPALPESQPMTTSSSSSSLPPDLQMEKTSASPYGTRSRNRTGNSRINYAEDREPDTEYELGSGRKSQSSSGHSIPNGLHSGDNDKASAGNTRRSSTTTPNGLTSNIKATAPNPQNVNLPGMSTFSAYPDPNTTPATSAPTRKRKAPGSVPVASHNPAITAPNPPVVVSRRNGASPQARRLQTSNLMTFDHCQGYLKNGKLKADDGTTLAVNGESLHR